MNLKNTNWLMANGPNVLLGYLLQQFFPLVTRETAIDDENSKFVAQ